ncbi:MAG: GIY-YIG nuclease family protein [Oceanicaulis sp.]
MNTYFVYIMTNRPRGVLYTGVTSDLVNRVHQHRNALLPGFTQTYNLKTLVWFETFGDIDAAIVREKRIKRWRRAWKIDMIETRNPGWLDLWYELTA